MPYYKLAENFEIVSFVKKTETLGVYFNHPVARVRKTIPINANPYQQKYYNIWYAKKCNTLKEALGELLAQEILRFFYPQQPKTRLAVSKWGEVFILSKEIPGFTPLNMDNTNFKKYIEQGSIKGLGIILVLALLVQEIDLKNGNIGLDKDFNITKIDGDNCFIHIFEHIANIFGPTDIENLPFIQTYYSFNWFDIVEEGVKKISDFFPPGFNKIPALRQEINETILSIILMSDQQFKQFAQFYLGDDELMHQFVNELLSARNKFHYAALKSPSFQDFFKNISLSSFVTSLANRMENFTNMGKMQIFKNAHMAQSMMTQLKTICAELSVNHPQSVQQPKPKPIPAFPIEQAYQYSKIMSKKDTAKKLGMTEWTFGSRLKSSYAVTYTQLRGMAQTDFNKLLNTQNQISNQNSCDTPTTQRLPTTNLPYNPVNRRKFAFLQNTRETTNPGPATVNTNRLKM